MNGKNGKDINFSCKKRDKGYHVSPSQLVEQGLNIVNHHYCNIIHKYMEINFYCNTTNYATIWDFFLRLRRQRTSEWQDLTMTLLDNTVPHVPRIVHILLVARPHRA